MREGKTAEALDAAEKWYRLDYELGLKEPEPKTHPKSLWDYRLAHALGRLAARRGNQAEAQKQIAAARKILDADPRMAEAPVEVWVRELHRKRFGSRQPPAAKPPPPLANPAEVAPFIPDPPSASAPPADVVNEQDIAPGASRDEMPPEENDPGMAFEEWDEPERDTPLSDAEVADENRQLLRRRDAFRRCAELLAKTAARLDFVQRVVLFGSVAAPLQKEVPRFARLRRARIAVWHECKDVDLAIWVSDLTRLRELKRAVSDATNRWQTIAAAERFPGVAHHQVDVFIMEPGTNRYRGNLCHYGQCPKGKPECEVAGCGAQPFLRLYADFAFNPRAPLGEHAVVLFDRVPPVAES